MSREAFEAWRISYQSSEQAAFFRARSGDGLAGRVFQRAQLLGVVTLRAGVCALLKCKTVGLQTGRAKRNGQEPRERTSEHYAGFSSDHGGSGTV